MDLRAKSVTKSLDSVEYSEAQKAFHALMADRLSSLAIELAAAAPPGEIDVGRAIAGLDSLHQAYSAFSHALVLAAIAKKK
jgi:hypothetical protein